MKAYFVTSTDTGVGKTTLSVAFLKSLRQQGKTTAAFKPVASGCIINQAGQLRNDDAVQLQQAMTLALPYETINPYVFAPPIAPHLAAKEQGLTLSVPLLIEKTQPLLSSQADYLFVEGVGGWLCPLNATQTMADYVIHFQMPVILIVGMRLGCLNHALLTYHLLKIQNLKIAGWVANCIDPNMLYLTENIATLKQRIKAPLMAVVPYNQYDRVDFFD